MSNVYARVKEQARQAFLREAEESRPSMLKYEYYWEVGIYDAIIDVDYRNTSVDELLAIALHKPQILLQQPTEWRNAHSQDTIAGAILDAMAHFIHLELMDELRPPEFHSDPGPCAVVEEDEEYQLSREAGSPAPG